MDPISIARSYLADHSYALSEVTQTQVGRLLSAMRRIGGPFSATLQWTDAEATFELDQVACAVPSDPLDVVWRHCLGIAMHDEAGVLLLRKASSLSLAGDAPQAILYAAELTNGQWSPVAPDGMRTLMPSDPSDPVLFARWE